MHLSKILKKVRLKRTLHIFMCKKSADTLRYHIFVCNIGSAILHFRMLHKYGQNYLIFACNKCSNITHLLYYKNFNGYGLRIENSVTMVAVQHREACRVVTHKSTVARTVMCRQDGRGRFPVLLDDLSKCRTNSERKSQLS